MGKAAAKTTYTYSNLLKDFRVAYPELAKKLFPVNRGFTTDIVKFRAVFEDLDRLMYEDIFKGKIVKLVNSGGEFGIFYKDSNIVKINKTYLPALDLYKTRVNVKEAKAKGEYDINDRAKYRVYLTNRVHLMFHWVKYIYEYKDIPSAVLRVNRKQSCWRVIRPLFVKLKLVELRKQNRDDVINNYIAIYKNDTGE